MGDGLADELRIQRSPIVLGAGTPLFTSSSPRRGLVQESVRCHGSPPHLVYAITWYGLTAMVLALLVFILCNERASA